MDKLINKFSNQLKEAIDITDKYVLKRPAHNINKVLVLGMGGSGIAGSFLSSVMNRYGTVPVFTLNSYEVPNWIDENTLVIASSYSGNTEETLTGFDKIAEKGIEIISVTSGGKLLDKAVKNGFEYIKIPSGWPAPRACFGYSFVSQLAIMDKMGLLEKDLEGELKETVRLIENEANDIKDEAKEISNRLIGKLPFIYTNLDFEPLGIRFKQQLNENAKTLAHHAVIPEMNHNELVGWASEYKDIAVVFIKSDLYSERVNARIDLTKEIVLKYVDTMIEIEAKGNTLVEQMLYLVNLTDWVSFYLAESKGVDVMAIANINYLKDQLAKL